MRKIEVCLTPVLIGNYDCTNKLVVVTDVLRATSAMAAGLHGGVAAFKPVETVEEALELANEGYLPAAERNGQVVSGFEFGNSPLIYLTGNWKDVKIALTTTNGTRAIALGRQAKHLITGAFLNLEACLKFIRCHQEDVLVICAGWKGDYSFEDTLFAGALVHELGTETKAYNDAALSSAILYQQASNDLLGNISKSSHYKRLASKGILADIEFCMQLNQCPVVPYMQGGELVAWQS
jgi:2-phosphosulfolactate phosphatase